MMSMSIPYEATGRKRQKERTRAALLAATRVLLAEGVMNPTVEKAADRAEISRTTAYRYFANQHALLLATYPNFDAPSLLPRDAPSDPAERLDLVTENLGRQILEREPELRAMLRLSLEVSRQSNEKFPLRQGRAIRWIEDALSPLREHLSSAQLRRIAIAIRAAMGIEAHVWLTDIGGLSPKESILLMRSSTRSILRCALADAGISDGLARRS
jgi:AcrR family transcriptional regulator